MIMHLNDPGDQLIIRDGDLSDFPRIFFPYEPRHPPVIRNLGNGRSSALFNDRVLPRNWMFV